jgi:Holliday junction DNA helicase RuvB
LTDNVPSVSIYEDDIRDKIQVKLNRLGYQLSLRNKQNPHIRDYRIIAIGQENHKSKVKPNRIMSILTEYRLNCLSIEKHIPTEYLFNSVTFRLELLRGLLDADGTIQKGGELVYSTSSPVLSNDVQFLVQSLGGTASTWTKVPTYTHNGEKKKGNPAYITYIKLPDEIIPVTSKKHLARYRGRNLVGVFRQIRSIEKVGREECQCIKVANEHQLYLTNDCIVTHNTTLALCVAKEIGTELSIANAATIKSPRDLITCLRDVEENGVVFIDEIHSLPRMVEEFLYTALEDFRIDIPIGRTRNVVSRELNPFTLIGATTHVGKVSSPLRDRFIFREQLALYTDEEIAQIVEINAGKLGCTMKWEGAMAIATKARSTPRISVSYLRWCRDFAQMRHTNDLTVDLVEEAMWDQGIDKMGLTANDRRYLKVLDETFQGGPAGVAALANTLLIADVTISDDIEPFLLTRGLVLRTSSGRQLTSAGVTYCQKMKEAGL